MRGQCHVCTGKGFYAWECNGCGQQRRLTSEIASAYDAHPGSYLRQRDRQAYLSGHFPEFAFVAREGGLYR